MIDVELLRDVGNAKAGESIRVSNSWAVYAINAGLAKMPENKTAKKIEPAEKPETTEEE